MSIEEAIREGLVKFLRKEDRDVVEVTGFTEKCYSDGRANVFIHYIDEDYDPCTFVYGDRLFDLIRFIDRYL